MISTKWRKSLPPKRFCRHRPKKRCRAQPDFLTSPKAQNGPKVSQKDSSSVPQPTKKPNEDPEQPQSMAGNGKLLSRATTGMAGNGKLLSRTTACMAGNGKLSPSATITTPENQPKPSHYEVDEATTYHNNEGSSPSILASQQQPFIQPQPDLPEGRGSAQGKGVWPPQISRASWDSLDPLYTKRKVGKWWNHKKVFEQPIFSTQPALLLGICTWKPKIMVKCCGSPNETLQKGVLLRQPQPPKLPSFG